eukprot:7333104-Alexandrium_andersonii.AAC.1
MRLRCVRTTTPRSAQLPHLTPGPRPQSRPKSVSARSYVAPTPFTEAAQRELPSAAREVGGREACAARERAAGRRESAYPMRAARHQPRWT